MEQALARHWRLEQRVDEPALFFPTQSQSLMLVNDSMRRLLGNGDNKRSR